MSVIDKRVAIPRTIVGLGFAVMALLPLVWMVLAGFKENSEVTASPVRLLPTTWMVSNYTSIAADPTFLRSVALTGLGAVLFTVGSLLVN